MLLTYQTFIRKFGVRQLQQLMSPHFYDLVFMELPQESVYHYFDYEGVTIGPAKDEALLRHIRRLVPIEPVLAFQGPLVGQPRRADPSIPTELRDYFHHNRQFRQVRSLPQALTDKQAPLVVNYAPLGKGFKYAQSAFSAYYRWKNIFTTAIHQIADLTQQSNRQHFLPVSAPKVIPGFQQLQAAAKELNPTSIKLFRDNNAFVLLELWRWLTDAPEMSVFHQIPRDKIHLVNLLFVESGKWCALNLGFLNSFKKWDHLPTDVDGNHGYTLTSKMKIDGVQVAKRLLRLYLATMELRTIAAKNPTDEAAPSELSDGAVIQNGVEGVDDDDDDDDVSLKKPIEPDTSNEAEAKQVARNADVLLGLPDLDQFQVLDDLSEEDFKAVIAEQDKQLDADLHQLEEIFARREAEMAKTKPSIEEVVVAPAPVEPEAPIKTLVDGLASSGVLSPGEHRRFERLAESYKTIPAPNGEGTLESYVQIPPELLKLEAPPAMADSHAVLDKSMLHSSLNEFHSNYVKHVLGRDTAHMVLAVQKAGVALTNYRVEKKEDVLGAYEEHVLKVSPVIGVQSTLRFMVPVVKPDGTFVSNGVPYRLRMQRGELPIRKTAPDRVALTTYYGKCFVTRGRSVATNYGAWLQHGITNLLLDKTQQVLGNPVAADVFDPSLKAPRSYSAIAKVLSSATVQGWEVVFDRQRVLTEVAPEALKQFEKSGQLIVGWKLGADMKPVAWLVLDRFGALFATNGTDVNKLGLLEDFLGFDVSAAPVEYTSIMVFGKQVPVAIVLGLEMGLHNLLELLRVNAKVVPTGQRLHLEKDEFSIAFSDETLIIKREQRLASLILSGFNEFWKTLKSFSIYSFDQRGVYVNLLEANGLGAKYVREIDLMYQMFVDPISAEILTEMKEPTTFKGLLFKASQMLLVDAHPDALDPAYMRMKGYERISGAVYTELVRSIRAHNGRLGKQAAQIELKPYAVWNRITSDPAKMQVQEINPIKAIKESEAATFAGEGGRNKRSMTKDTRIYHPNDMGTISESTVDNSDVGINIYTSANPKFTSLRGMSERFDFKKDGATSLLSTSALLAPASDHDDPKRVNFIAIQQEHAIACEGYHQFTVRTGYDSIVAQRTSELFAVVAKQPGTVRSVAPTGLIVDYDDGSAQGYVLGRRFGNAAGLTIAHQVVTPLAEGDRFAVGEPICYNDGFFEPDFFNPKQIVLKNAVNATTVLLESVDTHEDSSAISKRMSQLLSTRITKVKTIEVKFSQSVSNLVKVGDHVTSDSALCFIEDEVTANNKLFDQSSIETLRAVSAQSPRAKVKGVVERIEVFYHGDKEDMSPSILELANAGDKELRKRAQATNSTAFTGKVDGGFRIDANPLAVDAMAIRVYITSHVPSGVGDKGVFANQMKTVHGRVIEEEITTEDGTLVDAFFGMKSIEARIVESPIIIGTTNTLLRVIGEQAVALYRGQAVAPPNDQ